MDTENIDLKMRLLDDLFVRLQHVKNGIGVAKKFGITPTQAFILWHLNKDGQTKASDIAKVAGLSPGAVTQVCDELIRDDLILRTRSSDDRRVVNIDISGVGRELIAKMQNERSVLMRQIFEELTQEEADTYLQVIGKVVEILEKRTDCGCP